MSVGVVLSGCGVLDGTEIHEAAAALACLTRLDKTPVFFAPDKKLYHEVDHVSGKDVADSSRNVLTESGRIARGRVYPLSVSINSYPVKYFSNLGVLFSRNLILMGWKLL